MFRHADSQTGLAILVFLFTLSVLLSIPVAPSYCEQPEMAANNPDGSGDAHQEKFKNLLSDADPKALRERLLELSCANAEDCNLDQWYAGKVNIDNQWMSRDRAHVGAAMDEDYAEYYARRDQSTDSLADHQRLANICHQLELKELERMHWLHVLRFNQNDPTALKSLGLTWHKGVLLTLEEQEHTIAKEKADAKARKVWLKKAKRIRTAIQSKEPERRRAAKQEMRAIDDVAAAPALIEEFANAKGDPARVEAMQTDLMATLGNIDSPEAVITLVRAATYSDSSNIQYAAIDELRNKRYEEFVPLLLSELEMPIESSVSIQQQGHKIVTSYTYGQEDAYGDVQEKIYRDYRTIVGPRYLAAHIYENRRVPRKLKRAGYYTKARTIPPFMCGGHLVPERHVPSKWVPPSYTPSRIESRYQYTNYSEHPGYQRRKQQAMLTSERAATNKLAKLEQQNLEIADNNGRIAEVLTEVTNEPFGADPKSWWNWWQKYLEKHPDIAALGIGHNFSSRFAKQEPRGLPRGTWVWTRQGKQHVESILPGDFLLSQNVETGELAYKVVLAIQQPQKLEVSRITMGETTTHLTPDHIVWVTGFGWKKVSTLEPGFLLHGISLEPKIEKIDDAYAIDSYDVIVDDFHTLFIGEQGVLVHDGSHLRKTLNALPGFTVVEVAQAAEAVARE